VRKQGWFFCPSKIERLFDDLDLHGFATQQPLNLAHPLFKAAHFESRHNIVGAPLTCLPRSSAAFSETLGWARAKLAVTLRALWSPGWESLRSPAHVTGLVKAAFNGGTKNYHGQPRQNSVPRPALSRRCDERLPPLQRRQ
jgi:hypothetical protein